MVGAPPGAVPQPPPPAPPDTPEPFARGGDTDVVFRLERDLPLVHRLRELASKALDGLFENWRMVAAGALGLLALGFLAAVVGGAYGHRPPPAPPPAAALPASPVPAPVLIPLPAEAAPAPAPARPAPIRAHPARARGHAAAVKKPAEAPARRPRSAPARW